MNICYSVIIPAWNAEKTLGRCLDSLLSQNRRDVEILLISDGSTDGTDAIGASYGDAIRFFRRPHAGVSAARNLGLTQARGTYVTFVDSDDYVTADYFAALDAAPECDYLVFWARDPGEDKLAYLLKSHKIMSPCNKRIRRALVEQHGLRFIEGLQTGEDFCFCFACALAAKSVEMIPADIYRVDISNLNSLSRGYRPELDETMAAVFTHVAGLKGAERYSDLLEELQLRQALGCLAEEWKQGRPSKQRVEQICDRFRRPIGKAGGCYWVLRLLLRWRWDWLLGLLAYWGKGRKFAKWRKKC